MQGPTHRLGGTVAALGGYTYLQMKGLDVETVHPALQMAIIYPMAIYGSTASDLDHHPQSIPSRDVFSRFVNRILHLTTGFRKRYHGKKGVVYKLAGIFDAKHRSKQTHSDLTLLVLVLGYWFVMKYGVQQGMSGADVVVASLVLTGLIFGLVAHLVLDGITPEGVWCMGFVVVNKVLRRKVLPEKVGLVPNNHWFATGGPWEGYVNGFLRFVSVLLFLYFLWSLTPYEFNLSAIDGIF